MPTPHLLFAAPTSTGRLLLVWDRPVTMIDGHQIAVVTLDDLTVLDTGESPGDPPTGCWQFWHLSAGDSDRGKRFTATIPEGFCGDENGAPNDAIMDFPLTEL